MAQLGAGEITKGNHEYRGGVYVALPKYEHQEYPKGVVDAQGVLRTANNKEEEDFFEAEKRAKADAEKPKAKVEERLKK